MPSVKNNNEDVKQERVVSLTYLEFYSGIGGWTMAIDEACRKINRRNYCLSRPLSPASQSPPSSEAKAQCHRPEQEQEQEQEHHPRLRLSAKRLAAFDHSDLCNRVLRYNFTDDDDANSHDDRADGANCDETKQEHTNHVSTDTDSPSSSSATITNCGNNHSANKNGRGKRAKKRQGTAVKPTTVAIERLTRLQLQKFNAFIWSMSPPW